MIAIPAVDLRDGACVQLVGGSFADERVRLSDAPAVARQWAAVGFSRLHVVDLDAAVGGGTNAPIVDEILRDGGSSVQVGGGVRSTERVRALIKSGATGVVVGTRAIEDFDWLSEIAREFPGSVVVAADVRDRALVTHGWTRTAGRVEDFARSIAGLPLGGILVTAVHREGLMGGTDLALMEDIVDASTAPVIASGGVTTIADLRALDRLGVAAAVIGMALYTGALDARAVAQEFGQ